MTKTAEEAMMSYDDDCGDDDGGGDGEPIHRFDDGGGENDFSPSF